MKKLRIVIGGFIGLYPSGGVTWDYIQYLIGLSLLGHDVYYIEDTGQYSTYRISGRAWYEPYNNDSVHYLNQTMDSFDFKGRWAYRDTFSETCYGMTLERVLEICASAEVFINLSNSSICRDEYLRIPKRVLIDSDPMFTQLQTFETHKQDPKYPVKKFTLDEYNYFFSFGENIGATECAIPQLNKHWIPTRQPICLPFWKQRYDVSRSSSFTTVMNWSVRTKLQYKNEDWGQKDVELKKIASLPRLVDDTVFKIAMALSAPFKKEVDFSFLKENGWHLIDPSIAVATTDDYRDFIASSAAEFSVAKETYVKANTGWFSCRSACYLAMGKPVITQETGWSKYIPSGDGVLSFTDLDSAVEAVREVKSNVGHHSKKAVQLACDFFDSNKVLTNLLEQLN